MSRLFISYRRSDCPDTVKFLHERLKARLPRWSIFYDHHSIPAGEPFPDRLKTEVENATVVLVIVGPKWLESLRERSRSNQVDHVREEIKLALQSGRLVVPVPVQSAQFLSESDLAEFPDLLPLASLNVRCIRPDPDFDGDLDRLAAFLEPLGPSVDIGTVLSGKYKLTQMLGEGGMGIVFRAEQLNPARTVAVKLIKPGLDTKEVLARFDAERQALAMMNHPNIAGVIDAGETPAGRPYFVMDYVAGVPITDYCDEKRLSPNDRLALFMQVCDAVQHAHQKGIIHRDIKPTNVLVETVNGRPVPKIIDFGLAKALSFRLTDKTLVSEMGRTVGTLLYSSPEQAAGRTLDIDTRTDIYSLGVLLYELLAGTPPFSQGELEAAGDDAMKKLIREQDPPKPSTKLGSSNILPNIAAKRNLEPARLTRLVRGDLDWIVMKALDKEIPRRYATAASFAEDVQHYLHHESVSARKPSAVYSLTKFARRNRGAVIATLVIFFALVLGIVGTGLGIIEARRQERVALDERDRATRAAAAESAAKELALKRFHQLDQANSIVADLVTGEDQMLPIYAQLPPELALAQKLETITPRIREIAGDDPLILAKLQFAIGSAQLAIGNYAQALELSRSANELFRTEYGEDHPTTVKAAFQTAQSYIALNRPQEAVKLLDPLLARRDAKLGEHSEMTEDIRCLLGLGLTHSGKPTEGIQSIETAIANRERLFPAETHRTTAFQFLLVAQLSQFGDDKKRQKVSAAILKKASSAIGLTENAAPFQVGMQALSKGVTEDNAVQTLTGIESLYKSTRKRFGVYHPNTSMIAISLLQLYCVMNKPAEAISLGEERQRLLEERYGESHFLTSLNATYLAFAYFLNHQVDKSFALIEPCRKRIIQDFGPDNIYTVDATATYAFCLWSKKDVPGAISGFQEALATAKKTQGEGNQNVLGLEDALATIFEREERMPEATELRKEIYNAAVKYLGAGSPVTIAHQLKLATRYVNDKQAGLGLSLVEDAVTTAVSEHGIDHELVISVYKDSDRIYSIAAIDNPEKVLDARRQAVKRWTEAKGPDHPGTFRAQVSLAASLSETKGFEEEGLALYDQLIPKYQAVTPDNKKELIRILELAAKDFKRNAFKAPLGSSKRTAFAGKACQYQQALIDLSPKEAPEDRTVLAYAKHALAGMYVTANQPKDAIRIYESLRSLRAEYVAAKILDESFFTRIAEELRSLYRTVEDYEAALRASIEHYEMTSHQESGDALAKAASLSELVTAYRDVGKQAEALKWAGQMTDDDLAKLGAKGNVRVISIEWRLALAYHDSGDLDRALSFYRGAIANLEADNFRHRDVIDILTDYIDCCDLKEDLGEAEKWLRKLVILIREKKGDQSADYSTRISLLALNLLGQKKWSGAEPYLRESLTLREKLVQDSKSGVLPWAVANVKSMLGESLFRQGKLEEAARYVRPGYDEMLANEQSIPMEARQIRITEAVERLVRFSLAESRLSDAIATVDRFASYAGKQKDGRPELMYRAACMYAICAKDGGLDPIAKSVALLEKCRAAAYFQEPKNLKHFREDEDLNAIRNGEQFHALSKLLE